jgi:hypothetical protein
MASRPKQISREAKQTEIDPKRVSKNQYELMAQRRTALDSMLWQTPALCLVAQAFLLNIALDSGATRSARAIACLLAALTAFASGQLLAKLRHLELHYTQLLRDIERLKKSQVIHARPPIGDGWAGWVSFRVWLFVLAVFAVTPFLILIFDPAGPAGPTTP